MAWVDEAEALLSSGMPRGMHAIHAWIVIVSIAADDVCDESQESPAVIEPCHDDGPWPCTELDCPAEIMTCSGLEELGVCSSSFGDVWETPPAGLGATVIATLCRSSCGCSEADDELVRAEIAAREAPTSPRASERACEAAIATGRVAKGAEWLVDTSRRKVANAGHASEQADEAVRGYGLIALALHLEAFATQLTRELLRSVQDGTARAHVRRLAAVCGNESAASIALEAAVVRARAPCRAETDGERTSSESEQASCLSVPRASTAAFVAQ